MRHVVTALLLLLSTGCGTDTLTGASPSDPTVRISTRSATGPELVPGAWNRLPESPLSPRSGPASAHVGDEVVFVGGYGGPPCPPNAGCVFPEDTIQRDGAALDLETGTWRRIADAPRPVGEQAPTAVIGERVYVLAEKTLLVWDSAADSWEVASPPEPLRWSALVADGPRLVIASGSDENGVRPDRVLDTRTGQWSVLPRDPLKPAFDRIVTATPEGLVLTAKAIEADGNPADPSLVRAAVLAPGSATWRVLPPSEQIGGWRWSWTGERLVDPSLGGADGGETNNYGRVLPFGGLLDPATGAWSPLPDAPPALSGGWPVDALGGPLSAAEGWLYDDDAGSWTRLSPPEGAPETPGSAIWAGRTLVVHGGADWGVGAAEWTPENVWSTEMWAYVVG